MYLHQQFLVFLGPGEAEEETSLTECSDRRFAALLLRGECPADELKLYKVEVLKKFRSKLQGMSKQAPLEDAEPEETSSKGLSRQRTGYSVDVSWRSFRMRATHIPTLEQLEALMAEASWTFQFASDVHGRRLRVQKHAPLTCLGIR